MPSGSVLSRAAARASGLAFSQALAAVVREHQVGVLPARRTEVVDRKLRVASGGLAGSSGLGHLRRRRKLAGATAFHRTLFVREGCWVSSGTCENGEETV